MLARLNHDYFVAPRAGAWIETPSVKNSQNLPEVAPRAGAWIETMLLIHQSPHTLVAPRAGAWIETIIVSGPAATGLSPLVQGRGLKHRFQFWRVLWH